MFVLINFIYKFLGLQLPCKISGHVPCLFHLLRYTDDRFQCLGVVSTWLMTINRCNCKIFTIPCSHLARLWLYYHSRLEVNHLLKDGDASVKGYALRLPLYTFCASPLRKYLFTLYNMGRSVMFRRYWGTYENVTKMWVIYQKVISVKQSYCQQRVILKDTFV